MCKVRKVMDAAVPVTSKVLALRRSLGITEVVQLLTSTSDCSVVVTDPPQRPRAGEVYLFKADEPSKEGKQYARL